MAKSQPSKMVRGTEQDTLAGLTKLRAKAYLPLGGSPNSSATTTATTPNALPETSKKQERLDLVAGALADLQAAGILVAVKNLEANLASGETRKGVRVYFWDALLDLVATSTPDGIVFTLKEEQK